LLLKLEMMHDRRKKKNKKKSLSRKHI